MENIGKEPSPVVGIIFFLALFLPTIIVFLKHIFADFSFVGSGVDCRNYSELPPPKPKKQKRVSYDFKKEEEDLLECKKSMHRCKKMMKKLDRLQQINNNKLENEYK